MRKGIVIQCFALLLMVLTTGPAVSQDSLTVARLVVQARDVSARISEMDTNLSDVLSRLRTLQDSIDVLNQRWANLRGDSIRAAADSVLNVDAAERRLDRARQALDSIQSIPAPTDDPDRIQYRAVLRSAQDSVEVAAEQLGEVRTRAQENLRRVRNQLEETVQSLSRYRSDLDELRPSATQLESDRLAHQHLYMEIVDTLSAHSEESIRQLLQHRALVAASEDSINRLVGRIEGYERTLTVLLEEERAREKILSGVGVFIGGGVVVHRNDGYHLFSTRQLNDSTKVLQLESSNRTTPELLMNLRLPIADRWGLLFGLGSSLADSPGLVDAISIGAGWRIREEIRADLVGGFSIRLSAQQPVSGLRDSNGRELSSADALKLLQTSDLRIPVNRELGDVLKRSTQMAFFFGVQVPTDLARLMERERDR